MKHTDGLARQVFLHADDLGMNRSVTDGILAGFTHGLLTSTSVLANAPAFEYAISRWHWLEQERAAARLASAANRRRLHDPVNVPFDLGVHLNLTQGRPLTADFPTELLDANGCFPGIGQIFQRLMFGAGRWREAIESELSAQITRVIDYDLKPTHLNGHQYVELVPGVAEIIPDMAKRFQISVVRVALERCLSTAFRRSPRPFSNGCLALVKYGFARRFRSRVRQHKLGHPDAFCGTAHAGFVSVDVLRRFVVARLRGQNLEIGLHPGLEPTETDSQAIADGWLDPLAQQRPQELALLQCHDTADLLAAAELRLARLAAIPPISKSSDVESVRRTHWPLPSRS